MIEKNFLPSGRINFTRFVFYRSLLENETRYGEEGEKAYLRARNYLEQKDEDIQIQNFSSALNLLKKIVDNEKRKEFLFLKENFLNNPLVPEKIRDEIREFVYEGNFNYFQFIKLLNNVYTENELLQKKLEEERERILEITKISNRGITRFRGAYFKKLKWEASDYLKRIKQKKGVSLRSELFKGYQKVKMVDGIATPTFTRYISADTTRLLSKLVNERERNLYLQDLRKRNQSKIVRLINQELSTKKGYQLLVNVLQEDNPVKLRQITEILDLVVLQYLNRAFSIEIAEMEKENPSKSNKELLFSYLRDSNDYKNRDRFSQEISEQIDKLFEHSGETLFDLSFLDSLSKDIYAENFDPATELKKEKENLKKELSAYGLITAKGRLVSEGKQKKTLEKLSGKEKEELERVIEAFQKIKISPASIAKSMKLKQGGKVWFQSEVGGALTQLASGAINTYLSGSSSNKDDSITMYLNYDLPDLDIENSAVDKIYREIQRDVTSATKKYNEALIESSSTGEMDLASIKERNKKLRAAAEKFQRAIDKQNEKLSEQLEVNRKIVNLFTVHETNKDYGFLDNDIGFTAGALGKSAGKGLPPDLFSALENISRMAEMGGLKKIDVKRLAFCAINCANFLVAGEANLQEPLESYLSLLAGALMFNDAELIMQEVNNSIKVPSSVHQIHLYRLNNLYFPLSFILQNTYEAFSELSIEAARLYNRGNQVHIINKYQWENFKSIKTLTEETWRSTGEKAIKSTTIQMTFLAGFADILEELSNRLTSP